MLCFVFVDYIMIRGFSLCIELILEAEASVPPKCAHAVLRTNVSLYHVLMREPDRRFATQAAPKWSGAERRGSVNRL